MKIKYKYAITVNLRDKDCRILTQKFYYFNCLRELHQFIEVCHLLKWEVINILQEVQE